MDRRSDWARVNWRLALDGRHGAVDDCKDTRQVLVEIASRDLTNRQPVSR